MHAKLFDCATPAMSGTQHIYNWEQKTTNLKVSHAAINTRKPFCTSQKQTFDRLVLLPTPFTPTKVMLYGSRCCEDGRREESLFRIERRRSVDVFGVRIRVIDAESAWRTADDVADEGL